MNILEFNNFKLKRKEMVEKQLFYNGIDNKGVLKAFLKVPRHLFVPEEYRDKSYEDTPLPIGYSQTISQPYVVGYMLQELNLKKWHRVLEVGTGSGYQTAIICDIGCEVLTIELIEELSIKAKQTIHLLGYENVRFIVGDGHKGFEEASPYDRIIVSAATDEIPESLIDQLKDEEGLMIIPLGKKTQKLMLVKKYGGVAEKKILSSVKFVPLIKKEDIPER